MSFGSIWWFYFYFAKVLCPKLFDVLVNVTLIKI